MKNKKFLVIIATALMACLVVGMGAMTYSRYITTSNTTQTATAAKWGFVVSADPSKLFGSAYDEDNSDTVANIVAWAADSEVSVLASSNGNKIVAPGTTGSMSFSVEGTAEVKAQITMKLDGITEIHYDDYYPVVWTLTKTVNSTTSEVAKGTLQEVATTFNGLGTTAVINPGKSATTAGEYTLSWNWPLVTTDATGLNGTDRNVEDTLIGFKSMEMDWSGANGILNTYVGTYQILSALENNYTNNIETEVAFKLNINIEQVQ